MNEPLHVTWYYDLPVPSPYAAPIQILNTSRALAALGVPTTVRLRRIDAPEPIAALAAYDIEPHPLLQLAVYSPGMLRLARWLPAVAADAVGRADRHVILSRGESALALLPWLERMRGDRRNRFVYEAHRLSHTRAARLRRGGIRRLLPEAWLTRRTWQAEARALEVADGVVCLTDGVRTALENGFGLRSPVLVLPSGTAVPADGEVPADDARDIDVLYAGKIEARKGVDVLIDALARLPGRAAWVAGGRPAQVAALREAAEQAGVAERLVTTGQLAPRRVPELLRRARVGVCPLPAGDEVSERFTSPLKILEMMAWGVPIVATDLPSVRALLEHGRTALLVEPGSPAALAAGIAALLEDRSRAWALASAARLDVMHYSWSARAARLLEFVRALP